MTIDKKVNEEDLKQKIAECQLGERNPRYMPTSMYTGKYICTQIDLQEEEMTVDCCYRGKMLVGFKDLKDGEVSCLYECRRNEE